VTEKEGDCKAKGPLVNTVGKKPKKGMHQGGENAKGLGREKNITLKGKKEIKNEEKTKQEKQRKRGAKVPIGGI